MAIIGELEEPTPDDKGECSKPAFKNFLEHDDSEPHTKKRQKGNTELPGAPIIPLHFNVSEEHTLTEEQQDIITTVESGCNVLVCGSAGSGKSVVLRSLYNRLRQKHKFVSVTAPTGIAAANIKIPGAITLHSFIGAGKCEESHVKILSNMRKYWKSHKGVRNIIKTDVLIIDEISMVTPIMFTKLDKIAKAVRNNTKPFGGMQIVLGGDWVQIPPINKNDKVNDEDKRVVTRDTQEDENGHTFCFETESWNTAKITVKVLKTVFRQNNDVEFANLLNSTRTAELTEEHYRTLEQRVGAKLDLPTGMEPTALYSKRAQVDSINTTRINALPGDAITFATTTMYHNLTTKDDETEGNKMLYQMIDSLPIHKDLRLKIGCMVILTVNLDISRNLCNGTQGIVVGFTSGEVQVPIVNFPTISIDPTMSIGYYTWKEKLKNNKSTLPSKTQDSDLSNLDDDDDEEFKGVSVSQIPLKPAFALTIHKCMCALIH